ncbi:lysosome-associated membrane glycoprotein 1-like [Sinocyclocheilus grahami]|uniref:lysosome-associated membrane glycoprotein 1-like n=1 Tax=Sinocyclocheilus grahami TaxID=75366 RepID=UPI0007ACAC32|nr:PREDICTED: lysosome-associated membrane glycoprotein 1-like [Sinocyclocheilus grahami]
MTVMTNATEISARLNSTYRCVSSSTVSLSAEVNLTFSDVRMEAYMRGANLSTDGTFLTLNNSTTQKYYLSAVNVSAFWPDMTDRFVEGNGSLNFLQCSVGRSYVCSAEQTLSVVPSFSINTFRLQLQPFNVTASRFSAGTDRRS